MPENEALHHQLILSHLDATPSVTVQAMVDVLAARFGVEAVLFYGNLLRDESAGGLLDLYVLTKNNRSYHGSGVAAFFNTLLPPNVYFEKCETEAGTIAAKVAVMSLESFKKRMRQTSFDTTLWARFSQPSQLAYCATPDVRDGVVASIITAYETASWWAAHLSTNESSAKKVWENLFAHTYGAELRVEGSARATTIIDKAPDLYQMLYDAHIASVTITSEEKKVAKRGWMLRRSIGKILNVMRLIKAAFTFSGGITYALSKVERHSGKPVELTPWQKRWPWLAVPFVFIRLIRERRLR